MGGKRPSSAGAPELQYPMSVTRRPATAGSPGTAGERHLTIKAARRPATAGSVIPGTRKQSRAEERAQRLRLGEGFGFKMNVNREQRKHLINGADQLLAEAANIQAKALGESEMEQRPWKPALMRTSSKLSEAELQTQLSRVATDRWVADQIVRLNTEVNILRDTLHTMTTLNRRVSHFEAEMADLRGQLESGQFGIGGGGAASPKRIAQQAEKAKQVAAVRAKIKAAQDNARKQKKNIKKWEREMNAAAKEREGLLVRTQTRYKIGKGEDLMSELRKSHGAAEWGNKKCPGLPECDCKDETCSESVDEILEFIQGFKEQNPMYAHLHDDDLAAARVYTNKTVPVFSQINSALRAGDLPADTPPDKFKCTYYHLKNAVTHLEGVQESHESFWRGQRRFYPNDDNVPPDPEKGQENGYSYFPGNTVTWNCFTSISTAREAAERFAHKGADGGVLFKLVKMQRNFGAAFKHLSVFPDEEEILIPPGSSFRVAKIDIDPMTGTQIVTLEHVGVWALAQHAQLKAQDDELAEPLMAKNDGKEIPLNELHALIAEAKSVHAEMMQAIQEATVEQLDLGGGGGGGGMGMPGEGGGGISMAEFDALANEVEDMRDDAEDREHDLEKEMTEQKEKYDAEIEALQTQLAATEKKYLNKLEDESYSRKYLENELERCSEELKLMVNKEDNDEELRELRLEINLLEKHALSQASGPQKSAALQRMSSAVQKAKTQGLAVRREPKAKKDRFDEKCYHCHGIGHWKSECPYAEFLPDVAKEKARSDTVFVGGLENKSESDKIEDQEKLEEIFSEFGVVLAVTLRERREDGKVSWALVTYAKPEQAQMAIAKGKDMDVSKQPIWCNSFDLPVALKSDGSMRKIATAHSAKLSASKRRPRMQTMMPTGSSPQGPKAVRFE